MLKSQIRLNILSRLFNRLILAILSFWQLQWAKTKDFLPVKREKIKHQNWVHLYRPCTSDALSIWDPTTVNNSKSTMDAENWRSNVPMFMCRQTGNLWYKMIQKGREKKGWDGTLRQNDDFFGQIYSFLWKSLAIPNKRRTFAPTNPTTLLVARPADQGGTFLLIWNIQSSPSPSLNR